VYFYVKPYPTGIPIGDKKIRASIAVICQIPVVRFVKLAIERFCFAKLNRYFGEEFDRLLRNGKFAQVQGEIKI